MSYSINIIKSMCMERIGDILISFKINSIRKDYFAHAKEI